MRCVPGNVRIVQTDAAASSSPLSAIFSHVSGRSRIALLKPSIHMSHMGSPVVESVYRTGAYSSGHAASSWAIRS